jgi:hypothetical protein
VVGFWRVAWWCGDSREVGAWGCRDHGESYLVDASAPQNISDDPESTRMDVNDQSATNDDYAMEDADESNQSSSNGSFSDSLEEFQPDHHKKSKQVQKELGVNVRSVKAATSRSKNPIQAVSPMTHSTLHSGSISMPHVIIKATYIITIGPSFLGYTSSTCWIKMMTQIVSV